MGDERVLRDERDLRTRCAELVRTMEAELDDFVDQRDGIDGLTVAGLVTLLSEQNDRLVATQRHLLQLVSLLAEVTELDTLDAAPHLALVAPASDSG